MAKHSYKDLLVLIDQTITDTTLRNELVAFLDNLPGFPSAPASPAVRYHHAYVGGLLDHIVDTFTIARDLNATRTGGPNGNPTPQLFVSEILLVAILHDIHKVQDAAGNPCYEPNILKSGKRSEAEPFQKNARCGKVGLTAGTPEMVELEFLHNETVAGIPGGIRSLALIKARAPGLFARLNEDVLYAIRYHDGAYGHNRFELSGKETPLMIIFHAADMLSSRLNRSK